MIELNKSQEMNVMVNCKMIMISKLLTIVSVDVVGEEKIGRGSAHRGESFSTIS